MTMSEIKITRMPPPIIFHNKIAHNKARKRVSGVRVEKYLKTSQLDKWCSVEEGEIGLYIFWKPLKVHVVS